VVSAERGQRRGACRTGRRRCRRSGTHGVRAPRPAAGRPTLALPPDRVLPLRSATASSRAPRDTTTETRAAVGIGGGFGCGVAGDGAHERHYRTPNRLGQSGPRGHHGSQFGVVKRRRAATVGGIGGGVRGVAVSVCFCAAYARPGLIPKLDVVGSNPIARYKPLPIKHLQVPGIS